MKTQLPKTNYPKGFTLIELLIVIAILAVLAIIGLAVFSNLGAQAKARNISRRADLDAIAKALEVNKTTGGNYAVLVATQFSNGAIPTTDGQGYPYCGNSTANTQPADPAAWTTACPLNYSAISFSIPPAGTAWKICTSLEAEVNPPKAAVVACKLSAQ